MRIIQLNIIRDPVRVIELTVSPEVANHLLNRKRAALANLEAKYRRTILIRPEPNFGLDNVEVRLLRPSRALDSAGVMQNNVRRGRPTKACVLDAPLPPCLVA